MPEFTIRKTAKDDPCASGQLLFNGMAKPIDIVENNKYKKRVDFDPRPKFSALTN
jgi:hypothetical protein